MIEVVKEAVDFLERTNKLKSIGYKKKEIASYLEMHAPVFSSLVQTVFPKVAAIDPMLGEKSVEEKIDLAFSLVNNLSKSKTVSKLPHYNNKLSELLVEKNKPHEMPGYIEMLKKQTEFSYEYIKQYFAGTYNMYYISSGNNALKKEPFMIKPNPVEKCVECFKGNRFSRLRYTGISLLVNMHTLSLHMVEENLNPEEFLMMNLSIPFIRNMGYMRGIFNTLNFVRQPIARKLVIHQVSNECDDEVFDNMEVVFYNKNDKVDYPEIAEYLYADYSKTECYMALNPRFDMSDLLQEVAIENNMEK